MTPFTTDPQQLVALASSALLSQTPVCMVLPADWTRPRDFPLPLKAVHGSPVREYRPMAVLNWVNDELSGEHAAAEMRERHRQRKLQTGTAPAEADDTELC